MKKILFSIALITSAQLIAQAPFGTAPITQQAQTGDNIFTFDSGGGGYGHSNTGTGYLPNNPTHIFIPCVKNKLNWNPVIGFYGASTIHIPCDDILVNGVPTPTSWETHYGRPAVPLSNIQNTGNDIQFLETNPNQVFESTAWDGDIPSFSFIDKNNPSSTAGDPTFIIELYGNKIGEVTDPDIVISPIHSNFNGDNFVSILIIYELTPHGGGKREIAVEQWNYFYDKTNSSGNTGQMTPANSGPNQIVVISDSDYDCNNPNIDVNNKGQVALTFESSGLIHLAVQKFGTHQIPFTSNDTRQIDASYLDFLPAYDPDVTVSSFENSEKVTLVYNKALDFGLVAEVYTAKYSDIQNSSGIVLPVKPISTLNESKDDPRIASPRYEGSKSSAIAITTLSPHAGEVYLHTNILGNGLLTYIAADYQTSLPECNGFRPAITFAHEKTITVAWTYYDCSNVATNETLKGLALNFTFHSQNPDRAPQDHDYFMSVAKRKFDKQRFISLSSVGHSDDNSVYYSFFFEDPTNIENPRGIAHKRSQTVNQPSLRKRNISTTEGSYTGLIIYPNPAKGILNINFENFEEESQIYITLLNVNGKRLLEMNNTDIRQSNSIDLQGLSSGIYYLSYSIDGELKTEKIVLL